MTTVYGANGVKQFIKHKITEFVYGYEDSDWEIVSMSIVKLYDGDKKQTQNKTFREIKMYGTIFNYMGLCIKSSPT